MGNEVPGGVRVPDLSDFSRRVLEFLLRVPRGRVTTYGDLARAVFGDARKARAVASALAANKLPDVFPCYKVVAAGGKLGGYNLGLPEKIRRLRADGIVVEGKGEAARVAPESLWAGKGT